jgi:hypothetical protein
MKQALLYVSHNLPAMAQYVIGDNLNSKQSVAHLSDLVLKPKVAETFPNAFVQNPQIYNPTGDLTPHQVLERVVQLSDPYFQRYYKNANKAPAAQSEPAPQIADAEIMFPRAEPLSPIDRLILTARNGLIKLMPS